MYITMFSFTKPLQETDREIAAAIQNELKRQQDTLQPQPLTKQHLPQQEMKQ